MLTADSFYSDTIVLIITTITVIIVYYNWFYGYWKRHKVPCLQTQFSSSQEHLGVKFKHVYDTIKRKNLKHAGVFLQLSPLYVIGDLNLLKNIMTKDFEFFPHRGLYYNQKKDPLSCHIFNTSGGTWKTMRRKLDQIFTPGRLKNLFHILIKCEGKLVERMSLEERQNRAIDVKKISDGFISDVIESCVFGLDWRGLQESSPFQNFGNKIFKRSRIRRLKGFIVQNFPRLGRILNIALIPKEASDFFLKMIQNVISYRQQENILRHDFLHYLTELKHDDDTPLRSEEVAAQCFIFFLAAMSTSPTAITFALYEISKNNDIQEKIRREINDVLEMYHGVITYESIQEMKFLDMVFNETLRKYPPAAYLNRKCTKDYTVSGTEVTIKRGTTVVIPILGIHHDQEFYPDPDKFDPERFNNKNKSERDGYAFLPFGEGPRICIGMRFGQLQSKMALISLLRNFKFTVNERTEEPLRMKTDTLVLTAERGIWLNVQRI